MNFLKNWFRRWAYRLDRWLFVMTLVVLLLLVFSQLVLTNENVRYYLNRVEFNEGVPYLWSEEAHAVQVPDPDIAGVLWVELALLTGDEVEILRNGEHAGLVAPEGTVIHVNPGDTLVLRGASLQSAPSVVEVTATGGLLYPRVGTRIETYGDYDLVGWAIPEN